MAFNTTIYPEPHRSLLVLMNRLMSEDETTRVRTAAQEEKIEQDIKQLLDQGASPFMGVVGNQSILHPLWIDFINGRNALRLAKQVFAGYPRLLVDAYEDAGMAAGADGVDGVVGMPMLPMLARLFLLASDHQENRDLNIEDPIYLYQLNRVTGRSLAIILDMLVCCAALEIQENSKVKSLLTRLYTSRVEALAELREQGYAKAAINACDSFLFNLFIGEAADSARNNGRRSGELQYLREVLQSTGAYERGVAKLLDKASGENGSSLPPLRGSQDGELLKDLSLLLYRSNVETYIADHASNWAGDNPGKRFVLALMKRDFESLKLDSEASASEYERQISILFALELAVRDPLMDTNEVTGYQQQSLSILSLWTAETMKGLQAEIDDFVLRLEVEEDNEAKSTWLKSFDDEELPELKSEDLVVEDFFPGAGDILVGGPNVALLQTHHSFMSARQRSSDFYVRNYGFRMSQEECEKLVSRMNAWVSQPKILFEQHANGQNLISLVVKANELHEMLNLPRGQDPGFLLERDAFGRSPIFISAMLGNCELFTELCRAGVAPSAVDKQGVTPLMAASRFDFSEEAMSGIVMNSRTNVNQLDDLGYSALGHALLCGRMNAVRALRAAGAKFFQASPTTVSSLRCLLSSSVPFSLADMGEILRYMQEDGLNFASALALNPDGAGPSTVEIFDTKDSFVLDNLEEALRGADPAFKLGSTIDAGTLKDLLVSLFNSVAVKDSNRVLHQCRMLKLLISKGMAKNAFVWKAAGAQTVSHFLQTLIDAWAQVPRKKREAINEEGVTSPFMVNVLEVLGALLQLEYQLFGSGASIYGSEQFGQPALEVLVRHPFFSRLLTVKCLDLFFSSPGVVDAAKKKTLLRSAKAAAIQTISTPPEAMHLLELADPTASVPAISKRVVELLRVKRKRFTLNESAVKGLVVRWPKPAEPFLPSVALWKKGSGDPIVIVPENTPCANLNDLVSSLEKFLVGENFGNILLANGKNLNRRGTLQYLLLLLEMS